MDHRCRSGKDCVSKTSEGAAITSRPDSVCAGCVDDIQRRRDELPHLAQALRSFKGASMSVSYDSRVSSTPVSQAPLNLAAVDLIDAIGDVIDRAGGYRIADLVRLPGEKFLLWRRGSRREAELDGIDRALDVRHVHVKADRMVGFSRVWQKRHAPCPECKLPTLGVWLGSETIHCANEDCGSSFTRDQYDQHCVTLSKMPRNGRRKHD